jgi:hypothetical protein
MKDATIIPATIAGFEIIEWAFADHEAPVLMVRREPVIAWRVPADASVPARPITASPRAFDLDGDDNTVIAHPTGAVVCRGTAYANVSVYIDARREALVRAARAANREAALAAIRRLVQTAGREAAVAVLERLGTANVSEVPDARIGELRAAVASELAKLEAGAA